ncbi:hypothetical protein GQX74_005789 [Glossina fuscipes]|nr:hypothetical protein GQX74_005789 [Glossina fuscipes]
MKTTVKEKISISEFGNYNCIVQDFKYNSHSFKTSSIVGINKQIKKPGILINLLLLNSIKRSKNDLLSLGTFIIISYFANALTTSITLVVVADNTFLILESLSDFGGIISFDWSNRATFALNAQSLPVVQFIARFKSRDTVMDLCNCAVNCQLVNWNLI